MKVKVVFCSTCTQVHNFLDQTGGLWAQGGLIGKVGSVFTSTNCQHGGQETTLVSSCITLLHHGMVIVGLPYSESSGGMKLSWLSKVNECQKYKEVAKCQGE